jgi:PTH1 family peptidyl-tRNA hydrolase
VATLVIGLGNPGGEYASTRHNVGWRILGELEKRGRFGRERREGPARVREGSFDGHDVVLARPTTFMNLSGKAGRHLTSKYGVDPTEVIVVHDDLDLPLGRLRVRRGGSAGGQKGVKHLIDSWQTQDFIRVRVGIGRPLPGVDPVDYVLEPFDGEERELVPDLVSRAADAVVAVVRDGLEPAMNTFNRTPDG